MSKSDDNIGGRDLDELLLDYLQTKNNEIDFNHAKLRTRALKGIETARIALSADDSATVSIENINDDQDDLEQGLTLEEFNNVIKEKTDLLRSHLEQIKGAIDHEVDTIELLGEVTRTTVFKATIEEVFDRVQPSRTMHSSEFMVKGASQLAAKKTGVLSEDNFPFRIDLTDAQPEESNLLEKIQKEENWTEIDESYEFAQKM